MSRPPPAPTLFRRAMAELLPEAPPRDRPVLVACSGGGDSVALALLLHRANYPIHLAHLHHGMRPAPDADGDQAFVRGLAARLGVPFHTARADIPTQAAATGDSPEMAARAARRAWLRQTAAAIRATAIATGHNADDQAETLLLRLARGTSPAGLAGIAPSTRDPDGTLWLRPLLGIPRDTLRDWLRRHREPWREDATNADTFALRNRVRHEILPLLRDRLNPKIRDALLRLADLASAESAALDALTAHAATHPDAHDAFGWPEWPLAVRRRLALGALRAGGRPETLAAVTDQIFQPLEKSFPIIGKNPENFPTIGKKVSNHWKNLWLFREGHSFAVEETRGHEKTPSAVYLSAKAVGDRPILFRRWRPGDAMRPLGLGGTKKLSDIFTDLKIPREVRGQVVVVEVAGQIAALPGWRVAEPFAVPTARSRSLRIAPA
ncbi:MAG: tRNA lysidine(34) synthetase TilS [Kiritimatiellae bacterium]|nr:tRNA lysidine(34) synthetase TilS [Kiritimatiellia bacterium]